MKPYALRPPFYVFPYAAAALAFFFGNDNDIHARRNMQVTELVIQDIEETLEFLRTVYTSV